MRNKEYFPKENEDLASALQRTKDNIKRQASLAFASVAMTLVLGFAMTVAWYSNILHTSELTFKAADWEFQFEGSANIGANNEFEIAPGESGVIEFSVANVSDKANVLGKSTNVSTIGVQVNIDKSEMSVMEPRVYFYVEETKTINEEEVERQYLSRQDSYRYVVYPGRTLTITKDYSNDYNLKWHWVDEVVGYYVRGVLQADGTVKNAEYIRPIEFDSGKATYDQDGNLIMVNGIDVETFILDNYLKKDGIQGVEYTKIGQYYEVAPELYIYLCKQDEVIGQNEIDKTLRDIEDPSAYAAKIMLTGVKADGNSISVSSSADLLSYINDGYDILNVESDLKIEDDFTIEDGTDVVIDLQGHDLILNTTINAQEGSSIGLMNGTITTEQEENVFLEGENTEIYLDNIILENFKNGIEINDDDCVEDSHIYITQCEMTTSDMVIYLRGNGEKSSRKTSLVIENSDLISKDYIAVTGNGTVDIYGTDIQIISSTIKGYYAAIYHPMNASTLTIKKSTLEGMTGMAIKGGYITVEDTHILGTGTEEQIQNPANNNSGYSDTGDAVYIEDNYAVSYNHEIDLVIKGKNTSLISKNANALRVFEGTTSHVSVSLYDGIYSSAPSESYLAENKMMTELQDGTFEVHDIPAVVNQEVTE